MTLISRLQNAEEGSRELDAMLTSVLGWHRVTPSQARMKRGGWISPEDWLGEMSNGSPILDQMHGTTIHRDPPPWTTSVDSALTLVPEGRGIQMIAQKGFAAAWLIENAEEEQDVCEAPTLPLAIVIACLKAGGLTDE